MAGKFEVYKDNAGEFRFRLKAANGQNIFSGQAYSSKAGALAGIESVKTNAAEADRFEVKESSSGKPYFVLKAANHQVIGQSQMYESAAACQSGNLTRKLSKSNNI
jgi:uncharacterized protein YegP (UPF0339 family)